MCIRDSCQGYVGLIANGEFEAAQELIKDKIPIPASIGRVCPHPCEAVSYTHLDVYKRQGICTGTPIDRILRNLHIKKTIVVGFYTDQCVSTSIRDLSDLGYEVDMIEDAMNAMSQERHDKALQGIKFIYANCENTESLLSRIEKL